MATEDARFLERSPGEASFGPPAEGGSSSDRLRLQVKSPAASALYAHLRPRPLAFSPLLRSRHSGTSRLGTVAEVRQERTSTSLGPSAEHSVHPVLAAASADDSLRAAGSPDPPSGRSRASQPAPPHPSSGSPLAGSSGTLALGARCPRARACAPTRTSPSFLRDAPVGGSCSSRPSRDAGKDRRSLSPSLSSASTAASLTAGGGPPPLQRAACRSSSPRPVPHVSRRWPPLPPHDFSAGQPSGKAAHQPVPPASSTRRCLQGFSDQRGSSRLVVLAGLLRRGATDASRAVRGRARSSSRGSRLLAGGGPARAVLLAADVISGIVGFLPLQTLLHLRRLAQQWRDSTDATVDEQAKAAAFFGADGGGAVEWSEVRWVAAARYIPQILERHCESVYASFQPPGPGGPRPGSFVRLVGLKRAAELNGEHALVERWDEETHRWVVALEGREEVYAKPENLRPEPRPPPAVRRRAVLTVARHLAVELAARPQGRPTELGELAAGVVRACGIWARLAELLLGALPLRLREYSSDEQEGDSERLALGSPAVDDYLVALAFLEDGVHEGGARSRDAAQALGCHARAAGGAAGLLAVLCASPDMAVVRRALRSRVVQVQPAAAEKAELLRSGIDLDGLRKLVRDGGFRGEHFFTSSGAVGNVDRHSDAQELARLAVCVRRARAVFDHLDADEDGRIHAGELLQFVDMAVPGLLAQQASRRGVPAALHRQQYAARMLQLRHAGGFVADLVHGAYAEDRESVYSLVVTPPCAAASAAVLHRALAALLTTPGPRDGWPRPIAAEAVGCCAELAWAVDLSRSLCLHVGGREVLGPPVAIAIRFHGATFTGSPQGLHTLLALASPAALAKCASTDYSSERWCNDVPFLVTHLLESAGLDVGTSYVGFFRRPTHAVEAEE